MWSSIWYIKASFPKIDTHMQMHLTWDGRKKFLLLLLTSYSHLDWLWIINFLVNSDGLYRKDTTSNCNFQLKRKRKKKDSDPLTSSLGGEENWEKESSYLEITVLVEIVRTICISLPAPTAAAFQCNASQKVVHFQEIESAKKTRWLLLLFPAALLSNY